MNPSCFSTLCTFKSHDELELLLTTLSFHHPNATIYCLTDSLTDQYFKNSHLNERLNIQWIIKLDKFSGKNRQEMEALGIWTEFMSQKFEVIENALESFSDTLFLDSDQIILSPIEIPDPDCALGLSPQRIPLKNVKETGYYNGGFLWVNNKAIPALWRKHTVSSRYFEQASLENLAVDFKDSFFEFGDNYNLMPWPHLLTNQSFENIDSHFKVIDGTIFYNFKRLITVHTHLNDIRFENFNNVLLKCLSFANYYKTLLYTYKTKLGKWVVTIPKQPRAGIYNHKNDSFRELIKLAEQNSLDSLIVNESENTNHCWLEPNILLYDRPTLEWMDEEVKTADLVLLGNGDIEVEGSEIKRKTKVQPWTFWPRKPILLEQYLKQNQTLTYEERNKTTVFIGNIENETQKVHRDEWRKLAHLFDVFELTNGELHKFNQKEYLKIIASSKFGLVLPGYGKKCHREIEYMAMGTVPVVVAGYPNHSFQEQLVEGKHFINLKDPSEISELGKITSEEWTRLSNNGIEYYYRNCHSANVLNATTKNILWHCI